MSSQRLISVALAILGVVLFSTKAIFVKLAYSYDISAITILTLRMVFSLPFYVLIAFSAERTIKQTSRKDIFFLFLLGFVGYYLASYFDFKGLEYIKASLERLILFIYPTIVILISYIFLKEKITRNQLLGLIITYLGILIVFLPELDNEANDNVIIGATLVFMSAVTYASYIVGSGWLIPRFGPKRFTSLAMIISCLIVIIHFSITSKNVLTILHLPYQVYILGFLMAIISTVIPSYAISYAIRRMGANQFSIFGSLGPISTIILAYIFLDERLGLIQLFGGIVVLSGVIFSERNKLTKVSP